MKEKKERLLAAPRVALRPDGELIVYDEKGNEIELGKGTSTKKFADAVRGKELKATQTITLFSYAEKELCEVWICAGDQCFCYHVDCRTGEIIGPCR